MAKTVVGLFDTLQEAQDAIQALQSSGFSQDSISLVANNARGEYDIDNPERTGSEAEEGAAVGATSGAILGGLGGLLVGVGALAIPGIGPVVGGGVLLATLAGAGVGAAAGGLIGALVGAGVPEEDAHVYAEGVRRGGALVTVETEADEDAYRAADILNEYNAIDIDQRAEEYRAGGWTHFDENAEPYDLSASTTGSSDDYARSSKVGTAAGSVAGAATGAAIGSTGGPVGTVVGGVAGAITGGGIGAAGDAVGEAADRDERRPVDYDTTIDSVDTGTGSAEEQREMDRVYYDTSVQARQDDAISVPDQRQVADVNYDATTDMTGQVDRTPSATVEGTAPPYDTTDAAVERATSTGTTSGDTPQTPQVADADYDTTDKSGVTGVEHTSDVARPSPSRVKIYREGDATTATNEPRDQA